MWSNFFNWAAAQSKALKNFPDSNYFPILAFWKGTLSTDQICYFGYSPFPKSNEMLFILRGGVVPLKCNSLQQWIYFFICNWSNSASRVWKFVQLSVHYYAVMIKSINHCYEPENLSQNFIFKMLFPAAVDSVFTALQDIALEVWQNSTRSFFSALFQTEPLTPLSPFSSIRHISWMIIRHI